MNIDNILVRMPDDLEYFLPACAVVQDYFISIVEQIINKLRMPKFAFTVEVSDESYFFFWPLLQKMEFVERGNIKLSRCLWNCVLDFTDLKTAHAIGDCTHKHVVEAWSVMFGAGGKKLPELGTMQPELIGGIDVMIEHNMPHCEALLDYMKRNYPQATVSVENFVGMRPSTVFDTISDCKLFVGPRGGNTYMAATMGKALLESYPAEDNLFWLAKPMNSAYRVYYGEANLAQVWTGLEELYFMAIGHGENDFDLLEVLR